MTLSNLPRFVFAFYLRYVLSVFQVPLIVQATSEVGKGNEGGAHANRWLMLIDPGTRQ